LETVQGTLHVPKRKPFLVTEAGEFNNNQTRAVINFFFLQGKAPKEIHAILTETLGEHAPSYVTAKQKLDGPV
jgi:hypothetical protein